MRVLPWSTGVATSVWQMADLAPKLRIPLPRRALVQRARLRNPFTQSDAGTPRLVLLAAGAGFGKTTLLTQWLAEAATHRVAWVSLDEGDADVQQFLADLVASLTLTDKEVGREAASLLRGDRGTPAEDVLASLINDLDQTTVSTIIALDDYHRAGSAGVHEAVGFLLDNLPPQVTAVITTRADPPLPLSRFRTRGELIEVRAADLRFTRDEADEFLGTVMDLDLEPAQVGALEERTEGWVAGLQLAALSARSKAASGTSRAVSEFVEDFSGSHRFVLDYLVEEVLAGLSEDARQFLLQTSVLDALNGRLCDALTGASDGQRTLEELDRSNLFLVPLDDERQWYRYHHLFADAMRARLLAEQPDQVARLHHAASRWYAAEGALAEAVQHAARTGDDAWVADLVELSLPGMRKERRNQAIIDLLALVPDGVLRERAVLAPARAWVALSSGDLTGAEEWLTIAEELASLSKKPRPTPDVPSDLLAARADEVRTVLANSAIYRAAISQARGDVDATVANAARARDMAAPSDHLVHGAAEGFLGLASWAKGDLVSAVRTFRGAVAHLGDAGNITDQLGATVVLANMALALGDVGGARRLYEDALTAAHQNPVDGFRVAGDLHVGLADVLREQGDIDGATEQLRSAQELGETASLLENRFRLPAAQAGVLVAHGDFDAAVEHLERAQALYLPGFFPDTRPLLALRARALIAGGRLAEAHEWAEATGARSADPDDYLREFDLLTFARLVTAEHRMGRTNESHPAEVAGLLARIADAADDARRLGSAIEVRMVSALLAHAVGDRTTAHRDISAALTAGVPAGYRRLFLDEGPAMQALLSAYTSDEGQSAAAGLARTLLAEGNARLVSPLMPFGIETLSDRELEVVRLLATDLTGPEIASRLFVSINTLRTHTKHIFTKLDVNTRRAAVRRAAERGLL